MGFFIRVVLTFILLVGLEYYVLRRLSSDAATLYPATDVRLLRKIRRWILFFLNLYPIGLLTVWGIVRFAGIRDFQWPQSAWFEYLFIFPFWIGFFIIIQTGLWFLLVDAFRGLIHLVRRDFAVAIKPRLALITVALALFFTAYVPARIIYDANTIEIHEVSYKKTGLPAELDGFTIALIADLQADQYTSLEDIREYLGYVAAADPDLILIAGDLITSGPDYIETAALSLSHLSAPYGIYACVGDHDNWAYRWDTERSKKEVTEALAAFGVEMVDNGFRRLEVDSATIGISFITNTYVERISDSLFHAVGNGIHGDDLKIMLTHQPRDFLIEKVENAGYDMYLAGHTHGGQITFLFPFLRITPTLTETFFVRGDFMVGKMLLVVNAGLGVSVAPVRYHSQPQVSLIKISSSGKHGT